jgi:hypothetical protein
VTFLELTGSEIQVACTTILVTSVEFGKSLRNGIWCVLWKRSSFFMFVGVVVISNSCAPLHQLIHVQHLPMMPRRTANPKVWIWQSVWFCYKMIIELIRATLFSSLDGLPSETERSGLMRTRRSYLPSLFAWKRKGSPPCVTSRWRRMTQRDLATSDSPTASIPLT